MAKRDYYDVLGVSKNSTPEQIKAGYRKQAVKYHPDKNKGDKASEEKFKEASEAYHVLSNQERKESYDNFGHAAFENGGRGQGGFGNFDFSGSFSDIFEDFFSDFSGGRGRSRKNSNFRGSDLRYDLSIDLEEAYSGKKENIKFPSIKKINIEKMIQQGESTQINIETEGVTSLLYFILDNEGEIQTSEELEIIENQVIIKFTSEDTKKLKIGTNQIKIFGVSNSVLKPDIYETNFLITNEKLEIPKTEINIQTIGNEINYDVGIIAIIIAVIIIGIALFLKKRF